MVKDIRLPKTKDKNTALTTPSTGHFPKYTARDSFPSPRQCPDMNSTPLDNRWQEDSIELCEDINGGGSSITYGETQTEEGTQKNLTTDDFEKMGDIRCDIGNDMMVTNTDLNVMDNRWRDKRDEILIKNDDENLVTVDKMMSDDEKSVVKGIEKSGTDIKDLCTHNRQGYCSIHKIKGDRKETKAKLWKKKKYGYGT